MKQTRQLVHAVKQSIYLMSMNIAYYADYHLVKSPGATVFSQLSQAMDTSSYWPWIVCSPSTVLELVIEVGSLDS